MTSIEQRHLRNAKEFNTLLQSENEASFAERLKRLNYVHSFLRIFPAFAPDAWSELITLQPQVDALVQPVLRGEATTLEYASKCTRSLVHPWCVKYQVDADWFLHVASVTMIDRSIGSYFDRDPFAGFTFFEERFFVVEGDEPYVSVEKMNLIPITKAWVTANPGIQGWDTSEETKAQFRTRAIQEYTALLDQELEALGPVSITPKIPEVNYAWVEWAVLVRAGRRSVRSVSKEYNVSRAAVAKGIKRIVQILRFSEGAT